MCWTCWTSACNRLSANGEHIPQVRITAGRLRGRKLTVPEFPGVRPTPSRVREALFNILGPIEGICMLDLFSGSGLMAVEAMSRGAGQVVSVEKNPRIVRLLRQLRARTGLDDDWQLLCGDVARVLPRMTERRFDLVFADPPYNAGISARIPEWLDAAGISCAKLVIEEDARARLEWPRGWTERQVRRYGGTCLHFLTTEGL